MNKHRFADLRRAPGGTSRGGCTFIQKLINVPFADLRRTPGGTFRRGDNLPPRFKTCNKNPSRQSLVREQVTLKNLVNLNLCNDCWINLRFRSSQIVYMYLEERTANPCTKRNIPNYSTALTLVVQFCVQLVTNIVKTTLLSKTWWTQIKIQSPTQCKRINKIYTWNRRCKRWTWWCN